MNRQSRCAHCRCRFVPHPRIQTQRFCSNKPCQRARQATWQHRHPDYWRQYRLRRADYRERTRLLQTTRDHKRRAKPLAKMDA